LGIIRQVKWYTKLTNICVNHTQGLRQTVST